MGVTGWQVSGDTYTRRIRNSAGEEATVVYRYLSGYQRARLQSMRASEEGAEIDMGALKARAIELAVVSWTIPVELSREAIERLPGDVFDRIFEYVSLDGQEPPEELDDPDIPLTGAPSSSPSGDSGASNG